MSLILGLISVAAGFLGSILGIGGGIIIVPTLTLIYHVDIKYAVAASLISIIATSSGAAASYLKDHITNMRLAFLLEIGTVAGALCGFLLSGLMNQSTLFIIFGFFLLLTGLLSFKKKNDSPATENHPWAKTLKLHGEYPEGERSIIYKVANVPFGLIVMFFAGILSALLGIGSGIFKVLAMDTAMKLPIKVSTATSNFMIGVTAAGSAGAFLMRGDIRPEIAAPVSFGIIIGSWVGAKVMPKLTVAGLRKGFTVLILIVAIQMILRGLNE